MEPLEQLLLRAYPNPDRAGCPGPETIQAMGAKTLPPEDPRWEHIWKCSPCFAEFKTLRDERLAAKKFSQRSLAIIGGAIAALLLIGVGFAASRFLLAPKVPSPVQTGKNTAPRQSSYEAAIFNFEGTSNERGEASPSERASVPKVQQLPMRNVELTVYLPRGSDDGDYQLELLSPTNEVLISTNGRAEIEKGLTRFTSIVDLTKLPPGEYTVRSRRLPDGGWRSSKAIVQ